MIRIKQILCPVDFSDFSRYAFDKSVAIARGVGASVTALHVAPFQATPIYPYNDVREVEAFMPGARTAHHHLRHGRPHRQGRVPVMACSRPAATETV